jgi:hypothetical protein
MRARAGRVFSFSAFLELVAQYRLEDIADHYWGIFPSIACTNIA